MRQSYKVVALEKAIQRREIEHARTLAEIREVLLFTEGLVGGMIGTNPGSDWILESHLVEVRAALALTEPCK